MKVLFLVPDWKVGGVTTIVENIAKELDIRNYDTKIVCLKDDACEDSLSMISKFDVFKALLKFKTIVSKYNPDIIHSHTVFSHIIALLYKIIFNKKICVINTEHGTMHNTESKKIAFIVFRILSKFSNLVTFVSDFSKESYILNNVIEREKATVVYNGIKLINNKDKLIEDDIEIFNGFKFCYVGRFSNEKNIILLLKAFELLGKNNSDKEISLYLIGDGEERKKLENYCNDNLLKNVYFCGFRGEVENIISRMDCLVLSSLTEGLPTVVLEAFSQNTMVVSTDCGGVKEVIMNNNFISKNNDLNSLVERLCYVLNLDDVSKKNIREFNYELLKSKFTIYEMVNSYERIYLNFQKKL